MGELQELALVIFCFCREHDVQLIPEWIPREHNERADFLSKVLDTGDWMLSPRMFAELDSLWGRHTLDCFTSSNSAQLPRFCSRWWNIGCLAVDAFTLSREQENLWMCPPLFLIGEVVHRIHAVACHGTLVVPEWKSAWWWPLLFAGTEGTRIVKNWIHLPRVEDLFVAGSCQWNWFDQQMLRCEVLALRLCSLPLCDCGDVK